MISTWRKCCLTLYAWVLSSLWYWFVLFFFCRLKKPHRFPQCTLLLFHLRNCSVFFFFLTYRAEAATNPLTSSLVKRSPKIDFGMARDYSGGREAATLLGAAVARDPFGPGRKRSVTEDSKQRSFYVSGVLSGEEAWWLCWWWWYNAFRKIKFCLEFEGMFLFCFCFPFYVR